MCDYCAVAFKRAYLLTLDPEDESVWVAKRTSQRRTPLFFPLGSEQLAVGPSVLLPRLQRSATISNDII